MSVDFLAADWPATHVFAGTTTRVGGASSGCYASLNLGAHVGDSSDAVAENRRRLKAGCRLPADPLWLNQVHGTTLVDAGERRGGDAPPTGDAAVSLDGRGVLGILTADCLPVLLCSQKCGEFAAIHCGWRSLSAGIVTETVAAMASDADDLMAWLGPAISQTYFEVGDEVRDVFLAGVEGASRCFRPNDNGRWQADLYGLARRYLAAVGVTKVHGGGLCTFADAERFYSYRRDGTTGRMASLVWAR